MKRSLLPLLVVVSLGFARGQSPETLLQEGKELEKKFRSEEALALFNRVLSQDSNQTEALIHASRGLSNRAGHAKDHMLKMKDLQTAERYSRRALGIDSTSTEAHFSLIVTLGLQAESAGSPREKIKNATVIREEANTILQLDSTYALAYFVLGKWHDELSRLTWYERLACELFFGGLPEGISMDKAVWYFEKALRLEPDSILFLYGKAIALHYQNRDKDAIGLLQLAMGLPMKDPDDSIRKEKCAKLLQEIY